ncbi:MAG: GGDEF domain-containing protein [Gammaproteobacteria bacterium]|nr:GGDEF domain-containing protein [Gammaproteobacteria bacterium]
MAKRVTQIAGSVDVAFFFLFHALGSPILAWVNIASVAIYVAAYYALKRRRNQLASGLIWAEVVLHSALGTLLIGWDSGFHYYLLMFIPAICLSTPIRWVFPCLLGLLAYYIGLDAMMRVMDPIEPIHDLALYIVHVFNLTVVFAMFSYLSLFYVNVVVSAQRKLRLMATTDPLTRLLNRRQMKFMLELEIERFRRSEHPVGLLLLDVDHFKQINDSHGHETGDKVLETLASLLRDHLRAQDLVARWGGEEFLIAMPNSDSEATTQAAERIRKAVAGFDWRQLTGEQTAVTVSIGATQLTAEDEISRLISRADKALYQCKHQGRNQVAMH